MNIPLNEVPFFDATTSSPTTLGSSDADSTPTFAVFEEATDTAIVTGNFTKRTGQTGDYRCTFSITTGNGFEIGKWYSVIAIAIVGGVTGKAVIAKFRVTAAETTVGYSPSSSGPIEHAPVGIGRILQARDRQDEGCDVIGSFVMHTLNGAGEELWWAIDLKGSQLAVGQLIYSMAAPTVTGAQAAHMTITRYGVFGTLVKFFAVLDPAALSTDDITVNLDISPVVDEHLLLSATPEVQNY